MHCIITFKTKKFDLSKEKENPINPICGHSLLDWIRKLSQYRVQISEPDYEDWGWYSYFKFDNQEYIIGASVYCEKNQDRNSELEWTFQIEKQRSFIEKLSGKNKMKKDDPCVLFFKSIFESEPEFKEVELDFQ